MNPIDVAIAPLDRLEQILPNLLESLSLGRRQIVLDQLRGAVQTDRDQLIFAVATEKSPQPTDVAAAIFSHPKSVLNPSRRTETASVIHSGLLNPFPDGDLAQAAEAITQFVDPILSSHGVRFIQWSTDQDADAGKWCQASNYHAIGNLEYLNGSTARIDSAERARSNLRFRPTAWSEQGAAPEEFAELVQRTYLGTLDCPQLARYRTVRQTIDGYRQSASFASHLWFEVIPGRPGSPPSEAQATPPESDPVGCVILAHHSRDAPSGGVIELVYMGLVPEARGNGWGARMLGEAMSVARELRAAQMIMAVDQANHPARDLYRRSGFQPVLTETVWVKSLA